MPDVVHPQPELDDDEDVVDVLMGCPVDVYVLVVLGVTQANPPGAHGAGCWVQANAG